MLLYIRCMVIKNFRIEQLYLKLIMNYMMYIDQCFKRSGHGIDNKKLKSCLSGFSVSFRFLGALSAKVKDFKKKVRLLGRTS